MAQLKRHTVRPGDLGDNHVVLLVRDLDPPTAEALGYLRSFRPVEVHAVYPVTGDAVPPEVQDRWRTFAGGGPDLEPLACRGDDLLGAMRTYLKGIVREPSDFVTVLVPEEIKEGLLTYLLRNRKLVQLKAGLLREPNVVVTDVPVVVDAESPVGVDARPLIPQRTVTLVFVSSVNDSTIKAINYARSLDAARDARDLLRPRPRGRGAPARGGVVRLADGHPAGHRRGAVPRPHGPDGSTRFDGSRCAPTPW